MSHDETVGTSAQSPSNLSHDESSDNHPTADANRPNHDEDVRLVRDRMCQMCTGEDETAYSENCRRPKGAHDCWLQDALDRILARYDALMREHEAVRTMLPLCSLDAAQEGCDDPCSVCSLPPVHAAHDEVEGMLAESTQQSHDVMTTSDREEQT